MKSSGYLAWTFLLAVGGPAAEITARAATVEDVEFQAREYRDPHGATLLYRLLKPAATDSEEGKHPLLLFLHGAGERGSDNRTQLKLGQEMLRTAGRKYGAFVLVPQCPQGKRWAEVDWNRLSHKMPREPSDPLRMTLGLIAEMLRQYPIDRERLYVLGISMGGYGTWDVIQRQPDLFAAAVPICGGGDETVAGRIKAPVWAFHGDNDRAVPVARSRNMVGAIKAAGGKPKYTEYPGVGHNCYDIAFEDPEMLKWLFSNKRSAK